MASPRRKVIAAKVAILSWWRGLYVLLTAAEVLVLYTNHSVLQAAHIHMSSRVTMTNNADHYVYGNTVRLDRTQSAGFVTADVGNQAITTPVMKRAYSATENKARLRNRGIGKTRSNANDMVNDNYVITYPTSNATPLGILSNQSRQFFRTIQLEIDSYDDMARCRRYGFHYNVSQHRRRRIFYGALLSNEPWELLEIMAAETSGIYAGMVFVQSNRTQNFSPRPLREASQQDIFAQLFDTRVALRTYINESDTLRGLDREHRQRHEILAGWQAMGMQTNDVGILADADETFSRDALRAIQACEIFELDYESHHCHYARNGLAGHTQTYESSPDCINRDKVWDKPTAMIGHCIEGIGDTNKNSMAVRDETGWHRQVGYGSHDTWYMVNNITDNSYPLFNAADFRRMGGAKYIRARHPYDRTTHQVFQGHSAFHLHNFFAAADAIKFKYRTYGHPTPSAYKKRLHEVSRDLAFMSNCVLDVPEVLPDSKGHQRRIVGGFDALPPNKPVYFYDADYRNARHRFISSVVQADNAAVDAMRAQSATATS